MFDFDAGKLLIIGVIALIVIGPKELPRVLRQVGQTVGRMRRMATEFQGQFMDAMKEADIQSIRDDVAKLSKDAQLDVRFDPARDIQSELTRSFSVPAPANPAPALMESAPEAALPTDNFTMPQLEAVPAAPEATASEPELSPETIGAEGLAPEIGDASTPETMPAFDVADAAAEPASQPQRKRKILLPKRPPLRRSVRHEVWNRTGARRGRAAGAMRAGATQT